MPSYPRGMFLIVLNCVPPPHPHPNSSDYPPAHRPPPRIHAHSQETLTIFTSDNGAAWPHRFEHAGSTGPMRCGKGTFYEGGVRVPTLVTWPGVISPATLTTSPASTLDIFPTVLALAADDDSSTAFSSHNSDRRLDDTYVIDGRDIRGLLIPNTTGALPAVPPFKMVWRAGDSATAVRVGVYKVGNQKMISFDTGACTFAS